MKKTYIKGINLATIKSGDKVWCKQDERSETEEGVVTRIDGRMLWADYGDGLTPYIIVQGNSGVTKYGFMYGIIVEEEEVETTQGNKHPQHEVIIHWANGGAIEFRSTCSNTSCWVELQNDESPLFNEEQLQWRIKPKTKTIRYRCALLKDNEIIALTSEPIEDEYFLRWIDPGWKEIEVEI